MEVNVKEARAKISSLLNRTQKGEEVVIVRRGKKIARLVPIGDKGKRLPDLRKFRISIAGKGDSLGKIVVQGRSGERY